MVGSVCIYEVHSAYLGWDWELVLHLRKVTGLSVANIVSALLGPAHHYCFNYTPGPCELSALLL